MQAYMSRRITDKAAVKYARRVEESVIYVHQSSGHLRVAGPTGPVVKRLPIELARLLVPVLDFEPSPGAYGTY